MPDALVAIPLRLEYSNESTGGNPIPGSARVACWPPHSAAAKFEDEGNEFHSAKANDASLTAQITM